MSILYTAFAFVVILGILVVVHEWGHFIAARMCGIRVDEFSIGFGPRAARIGKLGDTEYNIRWIPLGGFVKIAGMEPDEEPLLRARDRAKELAGAPAAAATANGDIADERTHEGLGVTNVPLIAENTPNLSETAEMRRRDEKEGFYAHPIWQRAWVIFAGPLMSFLLGYVVIFSLMVAIGVPGAALNRVESVQSGSEAAKIGLKSGDTIVQVNKTQVGNGDQMVTVIHKSIGKPLALAVKRGNTVVHIVGTPHAIKMPDGTTVGVLGFTPQIQMERASVSEAFDMTNRFTMLWLQQVGGIFKRHDIQEFRKTAGGPIFIAQMTKEAVDSGGPQLPYLLAQLSMSLALFNLLPIPILDGGHLLIFAIEAARRGRRLTIEQQQNFMLAGLAIIGVLFVLIMFNDLVRKFHPM